MTGFAAAAVLVGAMAGGGTPADEGAAEGVLKAKGLVLKGLALKGKVVYVLPRVEDAIARLGVEAMRLEMSKMQDFERMAHGQEAPRGPGPAGPGRGAPPNGDLPPPGEHGPGGPPDAGPAALMGDLATLSVDELADRLASGKPGLDRLKPREREMVGHTLFRKLLGRYDEVAADPEVKAALKVLNRGRESKLVVGPVPAYEHRVVTMAVETLREKGLNPNKGHNSFSPAFEDEVARSIGEADRERLRLQDLEKAARGERTRAAAPARPIESLPAERGKYVALVRGVRRRADDAQARHKGLLADPDVRGALADLDRFRVPRQKHRVAETKYDAPLKRLGELEATIEADDVPLEPDRDAAWVDAWLNGTPTSNGTATRMVVDPEAAETRLSARAAASAGVGAEGAPEVEVEGEGGRPVRARRVSLGSVRVGKMAADGVDCLVMPESMRDFPATLGRSFLDRFVVLLDARAGNLTLARVHLTPTTTPARAAEEKR